MTNSRLVALFILMAVVTYLPRVLPSVVLKRVELPEWFLIWLSYVPAAVLSALLASSILMDDGQIIKTARDPFLLASFPTALFAVYKKNMVGTVIVGIAAVYLLGVLGIAR